MEEVTKDDLLGVIPFKERSGKGLNAFQRVRLQRKLFEKYGAEGISVFSAIDGIKSVEEIRSELNLAPEKIVEILSFMEEENIVILKTIFEIEAEKQGG